MRATSENIARPGAMPKRGLWLLSSLSLLVMLLLVLSVLVSSARATGDASSSVCPVESESSPGFRSFLPDCRAYELVSPAFVGGSASELLGLSVDGEHALVSDNSGFADPGNLELPEAAAGGSGFYELSRTATGWEAESLDPPASLFARRNINGVGGFVSSNLSRMLFEVVPSRGGKEFLLPGGYSGYDLAVRERVAPGQGRFTVLGPMNAPGSENEGGDFAVPWANAIVGASSDLSRVFFAVHGGNKQLWPDDQTFEGGQSLYEYRDVEGHEPVLVGVENEGAAPWVSGGPHVNAGAELISQCGTAFDGVSENGETVLFTAMNVPGCTGVQPAHNEIYARLKGSETVKVSGPGASEFQGASVDGTKVFFTEGEDLYEYDLEDRQVTLLATQVKHVATISSDGSHVYFTSEAELTSEANANGEDAHEVVGEKLYVADTDPTPTPIAFVAGTSIVIEQSQVRTIQTTGDGEFLLFSSANKLRETGDTSFDVEQLFEYDTRTHLVTRVSVGQKSPSGYLCPATHVVEEGYDCNGNTTSPNDRPRIGIREVGTRGVELQALGFAGMSAQPQWSASFRALAGTGEVVFSSALALTPQAIAGAENAYEYRAGQVYLISSSVTPLGAGTGFPQIDESGRDIFFSTGERVVPQDTNTIPNIIDARENGGFPGPSSTPECTGEACQGLPLASTVFAAPGSSAVTGSGNLAPPVESKPVVQPKAKPCRKGLVRKHNDCVKAKPKAKRAGRDRRGSKR